MYCIRFNILFIEILVCSNGTVFVVEKYIVIYCPSNNISLKNSEWPNKNKFGKQKTYYIYCEPQGDLKIYPSV